MKQLVISNLKDALKFSAQIPLLTKFLPKILTKLALNLGKTTHITKQNFSTLGEQLSKDIGIEEVFRDSVDEQGSGMEIIIRVHC